MAFKVTNVNGYTTPVGNRALGLKVISWLTGDQYTAGVGFNVFTQTFGLRGIDWASGSISKTGNVEVECQVAGPGASKLVVRLYNATTGAELPTGALTADSAVIIAVGG